MSSVGGGFLAALLRTGAPVIAEVPTDLPDAAVDPAPVPGWRRMSMMARGGDPGDTDSLLVRACRFVVLVPFGFRAVAIPALLPPVLLAGHAVVAGTALAVLAVLLNLAAAVWVLRVSGFRNAVARLVLAVDVVVGLGVNLVAGVVGDPGVRDMAWTCLIGSVALFTLVRGVPAGAALVAACVPLHLLLTAIGPPGSLADTSPVAAMVDDVVLLVPAMATAVVLLVLIGLGTRLAMGVGIRRGRRSEHAAMTRALHDTVLQTLEAMALSPAPPVDLADATAQLAELRGIARGQAMELRRGLTDPADTGPAGLGADLASVAAEMAREGLRARLVFADVDGRELSEARRRAVRDAVREALRNTMKHAGTDEVVLRVEQRDGGIAVIARDHGTGFSAAERPAGFGISNSIAARLADVGGRSTVESEPGRGTRVTLWVPR